MFVYVGAYTERPGGKADGISVYRFDPESGSLELVQVTAGVRNPSFLALDSGQRFLYAVNELADGAVSAFARDSETGELSFVNSQASHGADPCYISVDASGRHVLVANYSSGSVAALPIASDGSLEPASSVVQHGGSGVIPKRQEGPHAHMIGSSPEGRFVLATDLGTDQILIYRLNHSTGTLQPNDLGPASVDAEPGSGPRHFAFGKGGDSLNVINELNSTITVHAFDRERGDLRPVQSLSTLPAGFDGESTCAEVVVSPDGRFVYGSNRGHDSIAIFAVGGDGLLTHAGHESTQGKSPRGFAISPDGAWLLAGNQRSDTIACFRRDQDSGLLKSTGRLVESPSPVAIRFAQA